MAVPVRIEAGSGRADTAGRADGIELRGLAKSYRSGDTVIPAVRGIDVSIAHRETVALLGPNGAGKSTTIDMLLGLPEPDARHGLGLRPQAVRCGRRGAVGAMLQTGALLRDLTVRELVAMMASLYPRAARRSTRCSSSPGSRDFADQRTQKLSGGQTQRVRFAARPRLEPRPARPRRADGRHGRRRPPRFLDDDARVRGARQDGPLRHPLPRGGRCLRRPRRADGARTRSSPTARRTRSRRWSARARSAPRCPTSRRRRSSGCRA